MILPNYFFPLEKKYKIKKDPTEQAKKKLKRDFDFSFDKEYKMYKYKGYKVEEQRAVEIVEEHGLEELKERLVE